MELIAFFTIVYFIWKYIKSARKEDAKRNLIVDIPNFSAFEEKINDYESQLRQLEGQYYEQSRQLIIFNRISFRCLEPQESCIEISEISKILTPNLQIWIDEAIKMANLDCKYPDSEEIVKRNPYLLLTLDIPESKITFSGNWTDEAKRQTFPDEFRKVEMANKRRADLLKKIETINQRITILNEKRSNYFEKQYLERQVAAKNYHEKCLEQAKEVSDVLSGYAENTKSGVENHYHNVLGSLNLPEGLPRNWTLEYDSSEGILIVDFQLPNIVSIPPEKGALGYATKKLNKSEIKLQVPKIHPAILIRVAFEIFRNDSLFFPRKGCLLKDNF